MSPRSSLKGENTIIKEKSAGIRMKGVTGLCGQEWGVQACVHFAHTLTSVNVLRRERTVRRAQSFSSSQKNHGPSLSGR